MSFLGWSVGTGLVWPRFSLDVAFVSEGGGYHCCDYQGPVASGRATDQVTHAADGEDKYRSNKFYISTTVRFD